MNKIVGIMQPTFLPWIGYFEMIDKSDIFVLLDDVQFSKRSWHQRNKIKGPNDLIWLTVPVHSKSKRFQKIKDVLINNQENWGNKMLKSIEVSYVKSPFFDQYFSSISFVLSQDWTFLVELNEVLIRMLMKNLGISTPLILSSSLDIDEDGNQRIIEICKKLSATELYDTAGATDFIDDNLFKKNGINVTYQSFNHPEYRQCFNDYIPYMSVIDLLFNEGPKGLDLIRSSVNLSK
jgi:hypothetical protein